MAITIDQIVQVTGSVISTGFQQAALITNCLTGNILVPASPNPVKSFTSLTSVGAYFGTTSDEYYYATKYFASYTNSKQTPGSILFSRYVTSATSAYMFSSAIANPSATVATIKALVTPAMVCHVNGSTQTLTLLQSDFAACTGLSDIATVIQTKLAAVLSGCTASIIGTNQFMVKAPTSGAATTTITYSSGNVSDLLLLSLAQNPTLSQGIAAGNAASNMTNVVSNNANWISLSYAARLSGDTLGSGYPITLDLTSWLATQSNNYIGLWWEGGTQPTNTASTTSLSAILVAGGYGVQDAGSGQVTFNVPIQLDYNGTNAINSVTTNEVGIYAAFIGGIGASVNYNISNGKINFAGKRQNGLATNVSDTTTYQNLLLNGYNVYGSFSTRASSYQFTENGSAGGIYLWIDNIYDAVWLTDQLQNQLATFISNTGRIPYNKQGEASITAVMTNVVQAGLTNGVIETGNVFDATEIQAVIDLVGQDITPLLTQNGYYIYFPPITAGQRVNRAPLQVYFIYTNGGAVNQIAIGQVFVM